MSVTFDAAPWFSEADAESIIHLAQQGWSSPWIADALQHRPGYEHLRELMQYATERLQEESLEDPTWSTFECIVSGPEALACSTRIGPTWRPKSARRTEGPQRLYLGEPGGQKPCCLSFIQVIGIRRRQFRLLWL